MIRMFKNILVIIVMCFVGIQNADAQFRFGAGVNYMNDLGISARANLGVGNIDITPKITYFFTEGANVVTGDIDAEFDVLRLGENNPLYIIAGLAMRRASANGTSNISAGINGGVGLEIARIYVEARYSGFFCESCGGDVGFAAGYYF